MKFQAIYPFDLFDVGLTAVFMKSLKIIIWSDSMLALFVGVIVAINPMAAAENHLTSKAKNQL